jgi:PEP-CTERM motif-containing protein
MKRRIGVFCLAVTLGLSLRAEGAALLLNEYNAVDDTGFLKDNAADPYFGRVLGNGGDWFELVVISDHLDVRGWSLSTSEGNPVVPDQTLTLSQSSLWSDLRSGTIITVSELVPDDTSYDPIHGDWWINVQAADAASGLFITASNFKVTNQNWQLTIRDQNGAVVFGPAGEGISPVSGIGGDEIWKLEANPSAAVTPQSTSYKDGSSSTFGAPNRFNAGADVQDFSQLRSVVPEPGALALVLAALAGIAVRRRP